MSNIAQNALRYDESNTERVDTLGRNSGQIVPDLEQQNGDPVIGFDCSGYFYHVMRESGYDIGRLSARGYLASDKFADVSYGDIQPGDMINFGNHIGIVTSYDPDTKQGKFLAMNGSNNKGSLKNSSFSTDPGKGLYYGTTRPIQAIRRIDEKYYDSNLDLHPNGSNPNPVLQPIPSNHDKQCTLQQKLNSQSDNSSANNPEFVDAVRGNFSDAVDTANSKLAAIGNDASNAVKDALKSVSDAFNARLDQLEKLARDIKQDVIDLSDDFSKQVDAIIQNTNELFREAIEGVKDTFDSTKHAVQDYLKSVTIKLSDLVTATTEALSDLGSYFGIESQKYHSSWEYILSSIRSSFSSPTNPNAPRRSDPKSNTYRIAWIIDPLVLDLDGDGIETVAASSGVLFDHNADGIQTTSGWVKPDDGLLVRDINGNGLIDTGRELFGDSTLLANGKIAVDGIAALADLDSNADGVIDAADAAFGELKVWQDVNQDGISQAGELKTLAELGITALNLTRTSSNITLPGGTQTLAGSYTRADGSGAVLADLNLTQDTFNTQYTDSIEVPEALQDLPDLPGMGRLRSLQEAAALSPALAELLQQYAAATTRDAQKGLLDQVLLAWAKTDPLYNDKPVTVINAYQQMTYDANSTNVILLRPGQSLPTQAQVVYPNAGATLHNYTRIIDAIMGDRVTSAINDLISHESIYITTTYEALSDAIYQSLLTQTRLKPYLDSVELLITEDSISLDFSAMEALLQDKLVADPKNSMTDLIELNRSAQDLLANSGWDGLGMLEEANPKYVYLTNGIADGYFDSNRRRAA